MDQSKRVPWFRVLLVLVYIVGAIFWFRYEKNAIKILDKAQTLQSEEKYQTAALAYQLVVERFSFSSAVPKAKNGLAAIEPAVGPQPQLRLAETWLESKVSSELDPYSVEQLIVVVWPISAAMLLLMTTSRIATRKGWAFLTFVATVVALAGAYLVLNSVGAVDISELRPFVDESKELFQGWHKSYPATYLILATTILFSLAPYRR